MSLDVNADKDVSIALHEIGYCLNGANKPNEAIEYFERVLQIRENVSSDMSNDKDVANAFY